MANANIYYCSYSSSSSWSCSSRRSFFFLSFAPSSPIILDNYFDSTSSSPQKLSAQVWQPHILPSIPRCLAVNVRDLESSTSDFSSIDDTVITETKRKASSIDKGLDLVAFYSDHHSLPTFQGLDKCQATRLLLESDDAASQNLLTTLPSPLAFPEELCLVYDECYIKDLIDREWKKEKLHHLEFECSHELVTRSRASTGGTIAAMHVVMLGLRLASANISGHGFLNPVKGYHLVPSGIFDDITVATSVALECYPQICNSKRPVLVINLDVYQKESMLRLFEKDSRVVTFNLHGTSTYHHGSSLLDCTGDDYYTAMLSKKLDQLFDLHNPGLVFFQAGVDALSEDVSGQFSMTSSGTSSGKQKIIPSTKELKALITKRFFLTNAILNSEFPLEDAVKSLYFIYAGKVSTTKRGIKVGAASSLYLRDGHLSEHLPNWTSPMGVVLGPNVRESMYCHLLCGLIQANEVRVISSVFAYGITEAFRMLEEVWEELCIDIRSGTLSKSRVTDASVRESVTTTLLLPNPQLSRKVRDECEKGWFGIIKRLWPNVKYIHAISTGSMEPYVPYLKNYAGEIPLVCGDYSSSECSIGVNLNPRSSYDQVSFTLLPYTAYFEFLPMKQNGGDESPVDITGVQIGEEYEVILTTIAGLYRYRLGDVIRITGFYHELPQFSYVMRRNVLFSLNTDKTDEREFLEVNNEASKILDEANMELVDFCGYADHSSRPGHYAIFWEVSDVASIEDSILARCCRHIDLSFNDPYQRGRASGTIGPLRLYIVKKGTFQNIMLHAIESGASPAQYKTPRCVKSPDLMRILMDSVVHLYINSGHADVN